MITIPLSDVVAFLQRKGVDLACLEGAPRTWVGTKDRLLGITLADLELITIMGSAPPDTALYLGRGPVCPAAMGWAQSVIVAARGWPRGGYLTSDLSGVRVLTIDSSPTNWVWQWLGYGAAYRSGYTTSLGDNEPPTPAARLRAVLLHEMGRV